jgi:thiazole synthase
MAHAHVAPADAEAAAPPPLKVGSFTLRSRLVAGTGKYSDYAVMNAALEASGCDAVTVAVRRERLVDAQGRSLLDHLDTDRFTILPNTAGCFSADDAVRVARLGREILEQIGNAGSRWVKLEVLGDRRTLLPDPVGTLEACIELVRDGFEVLCYSSDDPILAVRLRDAGATSVMPAGSPIGSGRGIANPAAIRMILEALKDPAHGGLPDYPVIVDAGVGTPSDVTIAMELGSDGVLLNTGIAHAKDPVAMAHAMRLACASGWIGARAGRIPRKLYATASSPWEGSIAAPSPAATPSLTAVPASASAAAPLADGIPGE